MNNSLKRKIYKMNLLLVCGCILLTSCKSQESKKENVLSKKTVLPKKVEFKAKETKYAKDNTTDVLIDDNNIKKDDIERVIKHGDHWHVFTKDGKEHITYSDPDKIGDDDFSLVSVVSTNILKSLDVVKILKHGDHYHVYTSSGMEYLTYENPASAFPNIPIGTYVGTHASNARNGMNANMVAITDKNGNPIASVPTTKSVSEDEVVKILRHGDHWHIYTRSGNEFISYKDPSKKYPNIPIGTYVGTHESNANNKVIQDIKKDIENGNTNSTEHKAKVDLAIDNLQITSVLGQEAVNRNDIVKILRHEDHWHIYDSQGREGIVYVDPSALYPNASVGEYVGSHGDNNNNKSNTETEIDWPDNITKILDHGNHWHLYSGDKEVAIVYTNPKPHYKEQIDRGEIEYVDEHKNSNIKVDDSELFTYESVEAVKNEGVLRNLDDNLRSMTDYGDISDKHTGADGKEGFYWLHEDLANNIPAHYHAITIKEIIQNQKAGAYGDYSAKEVVSALKWIIENPDEAKKINEQIKKENGSKEHQVEEFLKKQYPKAGYIEADNGNVWVDGLDQPLKLADFKIENGKVIYTKGELPKIPANDTNTTNQQTESDNKTDENEYELYNVICDGMGGRITSLQSEIKNKNIDLSKAEVDVANRTITVITNGHKTVYKISFADDSTTLTIEGQEQEQKDKVKPKEQKQEKEQKEDSKEQSKEDTKEQPNKEKSQQNEKVVESQQKEKQVKKEK